jgi:FdhD protein
MHDSDELGASTDMEVVICSGGEGVLDTRPVATEVPLTITANGVELATLQCTPTELEAMAVGFLFSSALIRKYSEIKSISVDSIRWVVECALERTPDIAQLGKRVYTSGCGKGVVYADVVELASRRRLVNSITLEGGRVSELARWLNRARDTRGVHTAGLSVAGADPLKAIDDIGRHNAVDKVIGQGLIDEVKLSECILINSGRTSSEILHKAQRAGIAICIARGSPTHQAVLRAVDGNVTLVGSAKGGKFTIYSHPERILL